MSCIERLSQRLAPITQEPINEYPETAQLPNTNHSGWVHLFGELLKAEKSLVPANLDGDTFQRVQTIFHRFVESMVAQGFGVNKTLALQDEKPIHQAAKDGATMTLAALAKNGADVNAYRYDDKQGSTPLYEAAAHNELRAANLLIQLGAEVNRPYTLGGKTCLPLHTATSPEMCTLLVGARSDINSQSTDVFHESALHRAARCRRPDTIIALLKLGALDFEHPEAGSALYVAIKEHNHDPRMGGERGDPIVTGLSVDLLTDPQLAHTISREHQGLVRLQHRLDAAENEKRKPHEVKRKEFFTFMTTEYQPSMLIDRLEVGFHRIMQTAEGGEISFDPCRGWNCPYPSIFSYLNEYFSAETGEHLFGKPVQSLTITNTPIANIDYISHLIAKNPQIERIDLTNTRIGDKDARKLLRALDKNTRLKHLILERNDISPQLLAECEERLKRNR